MEQNAASTAKCRALSRRRGTLFTGKQAETIIYLWRSQCRYTAGNEIRGIQSSRYRRWQRGSMNGLRFSIKNDIDAVRIELAGSLGGVDVETVYQAWQSEAWNDALKPVIVDITLITEADKHGRALLIVMHRFGAQIIANSRESSAIAQPIVTEHVGPPTSKPGWFGRLIGLLRNDQDMATFRL